MVCPVAGFLGGVFNRLWGLSFFKEFFREPDEHMGFIFIIQWPDIMFC